MKFIPMPGVPLWFTLVSLLVAILGVTACTVGSRYASKGKFAVSTVFLIAQCGLLAASIVGLAIFGIWSASNQTKAVDDRISLAKDTYGVELSQKNLADLEYPRTAPSGAFESYGTAIITQDKDGKIAQFQATLVWRNGQLQLLRGEGAVTTLKELPRLGSR